MNSRHFLIGAAGIVIGLTAFSRFLSSGKTDFSIAKSAVVSSHGRTCRNRNGLPDPLCTLGARNADITQENITQNICNRHWSTASIRLPPYYTNKLKVQQIVEYGYEDKDPTHYEEDHLISLEIGGSPDAPQNLWPQQYCSNGQGCTATDRRAQKDPTGAKAKDKVENHCHSLICQGKMSLIEAQKELARDWTTACR